ncbi:MAG: PEP-CTERM sorting domain-containing protein [Verrucomicrobiales bacterium]|nr:PEP-CTERM sorting domain-containing protein [Verrucomicrobiales bacterium]
MDLHPAAASFSIAWGAWGTTQVGYADFGGFPRASLWSGTAASWVDLHPTGAAASIASGVWGANQVGEAIVGGAPHASLWSGSAASWVDLHPAGATASAALGAWGPFQVGRAVVGGANHASLWSGSAASWVDLHPAGFTASTALGAWALYQVGFVANGGLGRASLWSGSAASWVDLHAFLPAHFSYSIATGMSDDGINYYISGYGYNTSTARQEALLWTAPVPEPGSLAVFAIGLGALALRRRKTAQSPTNIRGANGHAIGGSTAVSAAGRHWSLF